MLRPRLSVTAKAANDNEHGLMSVVRRSSGDTPDYPAAGFRRVAGGIRLVGLDDDGYSDRVRWLERWIAPDAMAPAGDDARILSQTDGTFQALILHGEDAGPMTAIVAEWRSIFPGKVVVAFLPAASSADRIALLRAGCDFVFATTDGGPVIAAGLARALGAGSQAAPRSMLPTARLDLTAPLSGTETKILQALYDHAGQTVGYERLLSRVGKILTPGAVKCLHVQIQRMRQKIRAGVVIRNDKTKGYRGEFVPGVLPA